MGLLLFTARKIQFRWNVIDRTEWRAGDYDRLSLRPAQHEMRERVSANKRAVMSIKINLNFQGIPVEMQSLLVYTYSRQSTHDKNKAKNKN